jgi:hypothetical protein
MPDPAINTTGIMNKLLLSVLVVCLLFVFCGRNKKTMSGTEAVDVKEFIAFFDNISLPLVITDSLLKKKNTDSTLISDTIINQFIGDTIFASLYGKEIPKIYAMGRFKNKDAETYLLLKTKGKVNAVYALAFTPENKYSANMVLMADGKKTNEVNRVAIDSKFTFSLVDQYKEADGTTNEFSQVYAYNNAGLFMMIMKDGLQKGEIVPILNPIDTLPAEHKHSGNYGRDERNFITIRDSKTPKEFLFFINMDKGDCQAELKGEAVFVTSDSAIYTTKTDPCAIGFKFGSKSVRITETTICGNKRPADCSFNVSYNRQKTTLVKESEKAKKKKS